jgi:hypothetical protein
MRPLHGITGDPDVDLASLVYLLERIDSHLIDGRTADAAKFAGVLAHFIGDSLSPPHAAGVEAISHETHAAIERSLPPFTLEDRVPHRAGPHIVEAAEAILDACYRGALQNSRGLPQMAAAVASHDEIVLNRYRLRSGRAAAEILSDALVTVAEMSSASLQPEARSGDRSARQRDGMVP